MRENDKHFYKNLFVLVLPIAFQNLMSALVSASDAMMLGMVNQDSLSAVSLAAQVQFVLSLFWAALTIGTTILAAQYWGKNDRLSVEKILAIDLEPGERFAVLVKLTTPDSVHPAAIEYDAGDGKTVVDISDGEGYISPDGVNFTRVEEEQKCNLCLKAYTTDRK